MEPYARGTGALGFILYNCGASMQSSGGRLLLPTFRFHLALEPSPRALQGTHEALLATRRGKGQQGALTHVVWGVPCSLVIYLSI